MHFLAHHLEESAAELVTFAEELPHVAEATRISLRQVKTDVTGYTSELAMLQGQVRASEQEDNVAEDRFFPIMSPFAKEAETVMSELKRDLSHLESAFTELVTSFGEDVRKLGTEEFFSLFYEFLEQFHRALRENQTPKYRSIWESNKTAMEEAEEEAKFKEKPTTSEHVTGETAKALYAQIITLISTNDASSVDQFKQMSRKYGAGEVTADELCKFIGRTFGARIVTNVVPDMAKLLPDANKRTTLLTAHASIVATIQKDREERRLKREKEVADAAAQAEKKLKEEAAEQDQLKAKAKSAAQRIVKLKIDDIKPVEGEEAQQLHKSILEAVQVEFKRDSVKVKEFTSNARRFGNQQMTAKDFYQYLTQAFDADFVARLVPDLARLLQDADKRHALLKALCESAPGWARFAGL